MSFINDTGLQNIDKILDCKLLQAKGILHKTLNSALDTSTLAHRLRTDAINKLSLVDVSVGTEIERSLEEVR